MAEVKMGEKPTVETAYPLTHHLGELRKRLTYSLIFVMVIFGFCYWKNSYIYDFVRAPVLPYLGDMNQLTILRLTEGFLTQLKLCLMAAVFFSMPFILFQLWKFIAPGLYRNERRYLVGFVVSASVLFVGGAAFAYYMVFPLGFKFFLSISGDWGVTGSLSISWYLSFVAKLLLAFGIVFELPVVIFFLSKIGIIKTETLKKYRKYAYVGIVTLSAIITPPDVISQIMMSIPLIILYELSIWITKVFGPKKNILEDNERSPVIYE